MWHGALRLGYLHHRWRSCAERPGPRRSLCATARGADVGVELARDEHVLWPLGSSQLGGPRTDAFMPSPVPLDEHDADVRTARRDCASNGPRLCAPRTSSCLPHETHTGARKGWELAVLSQLRRSLRAEHRRAASALRLRALQRARSGDLSPSLGAAVAGDASRRDRMARRPPRRPGRPRPRRARGYAVRCPELSMSVLHQGHHPTRRERTSDHFAKLKASTVSGLSRTRRGRRCRRSRLGYRPAKRSHLRAPNVCVATSCD